MCTLMASRQCTRCTSDWQGVVLRGFLAQADLKEGEVSHKNQASSWTINTTIGSEQSPVPGKQTWSWGLLQLWGKLGWLERIRRYLTRYDSLWYAWVTWWHCFSYIVSSYLDDFVPILLLRCEMSNWNSKLWDSSSLPELRKGKLLYLREFRVRELLSTHLIPSLS